VFTTETFADHTAVVTVNNDPAIASQKLQKDLLEIQNWYIKQMVNESQRVQAGFEPSSYRGVLVSNLLHAFTQFAECTRTDCK
jgi:hypothetical protein